MRPLEDRIKEATEGAVGETGAADAYRRVLYVLERQLDDYEAVWGPRFLPSEFAGWQAARAQLTDDIALVAALLANHLGQPVKPTFVARKRKGAAGYGEP